MVPQAAAGVVVHGPAARGCRRFGVAVLRWEGHSGGGAAKAADAGWLPDPRAVARGVRLRGSKGQQGRAGRWPTDECHLRRRAVPGMAHADELSGGRGTSAPIRSRRPSPSPSSTASRKTAMRGSGGTSSEIPVLEPHGNRRRPGSFVDPHGPAEERYKGHLQCPRAGRRRGAVAAYQKVHPRNRHVSQGPDYIYCLFGLISPDGIQWKSLPEPLLIHKGDTDNTVYYDEWLQRYVLYTRLTCGSIAASIARAESDDFRRWSPVEPLVAREPPGPVLVRRLHECPQRLIPACRNTTSCSRWSTAAIRSPRRFTSTRAWTASFGIESRRTRAGRKRAIRLGRQVRGCQQEPRAAGQDRVAIPYGARAIPTSTLAGRAWITSKSGWAWWPKGRLVGLAADDEGEFHTLDIPVSGGQLRINAKVRSGGQIRVGIDGPAARSAADCDPITGDHLAHPVTWRGDAKCGVTLGSTVRLHLQLRAAELFGLKWS